MHPPLYLLVNIFIYAQNTSSPHALAMKKRSSTKQTITDAFRNQSKKDRGDRDVDSSSHAAESADGSEVATGSSQQLIPAIQPHALLAGM